MHKVAEEAVRSFTSGLGSQLTAAYLYGSLVQGHYNQAESDINLLLVVEDDTSIHRIKEIFAPLWHAHHGRLRRAPLIIRRGSLDRHLNLNPGLTAHLVDHAQQLAGNSNLFTGHTEIDRRAVFAHHAQEALNASSAVAPELLEPEAAAASLKQLRRLVRKHSGRSEIEQKPAPLLLSQVQHYLLKEMEHSLQIEAWSSPRPPTTSLLLPGLESAYKELGQIVLSFGSITPHQIAGAEWNQLSSQLSEHYQGLKVTTSTQLRLIVQLENPMALAFERYQHEWGSEILEDLEIGKADVLRYAARVPSTIETDNLPNSYLTSSADQSGEIIHDFQNKMLNIQLEHELLRRMQKIEKFTPPEPMPDRSEPPEVRIDGIFKHLGWWAEFYANLAAHIE